MTNLHPATSGRHSAEARCDQFGVEAALAWLSGRIADSSKPPLDSRYIAAYRETCARWPK